MLTCVCTGWQCWTDNWQKCPEWSRCCVGLVTGVPACHIRCQPVASTIHCWPIILAGLEPGHYQWQHLWRLSTAWRPPWSTWEPPARCCQAHLLIIKQLLPLMSSQIIVLWLFKQLMIWTGVKHRVWGHCGSFETRHGGDIILSLSNNINNQAWDTLQYWIRLCFPDVMHSWGKRLCSENCLWTCLDTDYGGPFDLWHWVYQQLFFCIIWFSVGELSGEDGWQTRISAWLHWWNKPGRWGIIHSHTDNLLSLDNFQTD